MDRGNWIVEAKQLNDSILTISGTVLGFSVAFLTRQDSLESALVLKEAWIALVVAVFLNIFARLTAPLNADDIRSDRLIAAWGLWVIFSVLAFLLGLALLTVFGINNL